MKRVIFSMILVAAFVGCTKRIDAPSTVDNALRMNASQSDFVSDDTTSADTRATETAFQSGDAIGVYLHTTATVGSSGNHSSNMKYLTTNAGGTWQAASSLSEALADGTTYKATGYYPHKIGVVNPLAVPHTAKADQSAVAGDKATALENSDFMIAAGADVTVKSPQLAEVTLNFTHLLTKLIVSVNVPNVIENIKVTGVKSVTISGLKSKCAINLATRAVTPEDPVAAITPRLVSGAGAPGVISTWEAIVVPQSVAASTEMVKFVCNMEGGGTKDLTYTVPASTPLALNSGKKLTLTLSSSADLAFTSSIDLVNGEPKTNIPLTIKAPSGTGWTLTSGGNWLTVASAENGAYLYQITGTGTGANQTVYVKVDANNAAAAGYIPRSAALTLSDNKGAAVSYQVVQNYTRFDPVFSAWNITASAQSKAIDGFITNQLWIATPADVTTGLGLKLATSNIIGTGVVDGAYDGIGTLTANTLFMQVTANNTNSARTGKVTVEIKASNPRRFIEIPVTQAAPALTDFATDLASYSGTAASWDSGNRYVTPGAGLQWSIAGLSDITVAPTGVQSAASTAVTVSIGANNTNSPRMRGFFLDYGAPDNDQSTLSTYYTVEQAAPAIALSATSQTVAPHVTSTKFNVTSSSNQNGVIYKPTMGTNATSIAPNTAQTISTTGNHSQEVTVGFTVNAGNQRNIIANVGYGASLNLAHTITQQAPALSLSPYTANVGVDATTATFHLTSNVPFTSAYSSGASSGYGTGYNPPYNDLTILLLFPAQGSAAAVARNHTMTITPNPNNASNSQIRTFTATQAARNPTLSLSATAPGEQVPKGGKAYAVNITTNTTWNTTETSNVSVSPSSGTGNAKVTITVPTNTTPLPRNTSVKFNTTFGNGLPVVSSTWSGTQQADAVSVKWVATNLGASKPEDFGNFYMWGDTYAYDHLGTDGPSGAKGATSPNQSLTDGLGYDYGKGLAGGYASGDPCQSLGPKYKTPTKAQFDELVKSGSSSKNSYYHGIIGRFFGPAAASCTPDIIQPGCVFFPLPGYRENNTVDFEGMIGTYWTSTAASANQAVCCAVQNSMNVSFNDDNRNYGNAVRCVQE